MKSKFLFFSSAVLFFALFSGCKETEIVTKEVPAGEYLNLEGQFLHFNEMEGYAFFGIKSNAKWGISCSETWLSLSSNLGEGDDLIQVSSNANFSTDGRTANILVTSEGGITKNVFVLQGEVELVVVPPQAVVSGRNTVLTGAYLELIDEVWFGNEKGTILDGRTSFSIRITVPETVTAGEIEIKVVLLDGKEIIVGSCNLVTAAEVEPNATAPLEGTIGTAIILHGSKLDNVDKVLFGDWEANFIPGRTPEETILVTIPPTAQAGTVELKLVYLEEFVNVLGTIDLKASETFDPDKDLCRYAGSILANTPASNTPRVVEGNGVNPTAYNTGAGRAVEFAFDGAVDAATFSQVDYVALYSHLYPTITNTFQAAGRTMWQLNVARGFGEIPDGETVPDNWTSFTLDYTDTEKGCVIFDKLFFGIGNGSNRFVSYTTEISDDNLHWVKVLHAENSQSLYNYSTFTWQLTPPVTAKYVRLVLIHRTDVGNPGQYQDFRLYRTK